MALCARGLRRVLPEAGTLRARAVVPPRLSRVNGWSRPLHSFQLITWAVFLILAVTSFGVFIPLMPHIWRQAAYGVVGGIFLFHFIVHVITISINPAEASVHQKNYSEPVPVFDRSKHAHVIQDQYCHLCEATVDAKAKHCSACNKCVSGFDHHCKWLNNCVGTKNYWYFFSSMASSLAGLICILVILLYLFVQFLVEPSQLRTDPHFAGVSSESTWLLFLPALPVRAEAPAILSVGAAVLLLVLIGLVLLGQLFFFHLFLITKRMSTYEYLTQGCQQPRSKTLSRGRIVRLERGLARVQLDDKDRRPSVPREKPAGFVPPSRGLGSTSSVDSEAVASRKEPVIQLSSSLRCLRSTDLTSPATFPDKASVMTIHPENSSSLQEADASPSPRPPGRLKCREPRLPSRDTSLSPVSTINSEGSPSLKNAGDQQQKVRQSVTADVGKTESSASGAQRPALGWPPIQEHSVTTMLPVEEAVLETLLPRSSPQARPWPGRARPPRPQRGPPAPQQPWVLESTIATIPGEPERDLAEDWSRLQRQSRPGPQPAHPVACRGDRRGQRPQGHGDHDARGRGLGAPDGFPSPV